MHENFTRKRQPARDFLLFIQSDAKNGQPTVEFCDFLGEKAVSEQRVY